MTSQPPPDRPRGASLAVPSLLTRLGRRRGGEFGGFVGDSFYAALWLGAISIADLVQIALVARVLGLAEYGRLALVMSFVVLVGQFFDVRVGVAATTFGAGPVLERNWARAAGVFRFTYAIDGTTGLAAFGVVLALAPFVGPALVGDAAFWLMVLYALTLLAATVDESSVSVLRLLGRFRLLAGYTIGVESLRIVAVGVALLVQESLVSVLVALVAHKVVSSGVTLLVATRVFSRASGLSLLGTPRRDLAERPGMLRTVFDTNIVSYARIAQTQLPALLLGALVSPVAVGLYKLGAAAGAVVGRLVDPASAAVLPRTSRLLADRRLHETRRLVRSATYAAAAVVGPAFALIVIFREPLLRIFGGVEAVDAAPVLIIVAAAQALNGALFWNAGVLFAAGRSRSVSVVAVGGAIVQLALLVPLVRAYEEIGAAVALCTSVAVANIVATVLAVRALRSGASSAPQTVERTLDQRSTATSSEYEART